MAREQDEQPLDLTPLSAVTAEDPYSYYAALVRERPFYRDERLNLWIAASAEAVEGALARDDLRVRPASEPVPASIAATEAGATFGRFARMTDGADQRRLKDALTAAFDRLAWDEVGETVTKCSARFAPLAFGAGAAYERFVSTLPVAVVAALLGIDGADAEPTAQLTADFSLALAANATSERIERGAAAARALSQRVGSSGPLFTALHDEASLREIDEPTLIANAVGFLFQSYDATAGLIGNALVTLSRNPLGGVTLTDFVAEVSRYDAPVHNTRRFAPRELEFFGRRIAANDAILVVLAAANCDASVNPNPLRFDPHRTNPRNYTFGLGGHACPGTKLACTIAASAVHALLERGFQPGGLNLLGYRPLPNARVPQLELATP